MQLRSLLVALGAGALAVRAQSDFAAINNVTSLAGTWSSGSFPVSTGLNFFNPITKDFTMPKAGGISYSFTNDGFFETSTYSYTSNPANNRCFKAALTWQHGTYTFNANNSLSLRPFAPDGYVQIMDPCAATSVSKYNYNQFELIPAWYNYLDAHPGFMPHGQTAYALRLFNDGGNGTVGAPKSVLWLQNRPPNMLPTQQLYQEVLNSS